MTLNASEINDALEVICSAAGIGPAKFVLGEVVTTPTAATEVDIRRALECLARHRAGDWGDLDDEDRAMNDAHLNSGERGVRLVSVYPIDPQEEDSARFMIITDNLRSDEPITTILTPYDY